MKHCIVFSAMTKARRQELRGPARFTLVLFKAMPNEAGFLASAMT